MSAWRKYALAVGAAGLLVVYWIAWHAPAVGTFHDDGVYIVTAKALAEGKGYRIISLPSELAQTKYPILFPLLLAGVWKLQPQFPENILWLKLVPLLFTVLWLWLSYRLLREEGAGAWMACWICALTAASTWVVFLGTTVLSEAPFAAFTTAALLLLRRAEKRQSMLYLVGAAVCAALAFHTRTVGLALLAAAPLYLLLKRQWRQAACFAALGLLLVSPWVWWVLTRQRPTGPVDAYYSSVNYQGWNILTNFTFGEKIDILFSNLAMVLFAPGLMLGIPPKGLLALPSLLVGMVCYLGVCQRRNGVFALLLLLYGAMVCAYVWIPSRYVAPFLPLLLWLGFEVLAGRTRLRAAAMAVLTVATIASLGYGMQRTIRLGNPVPAPMTDEDTWDNLHALLKQTKDGTPADALLVGNLDPLYFLYTGRKAVRGFAVEQYGLIYAHTENPLGAPDRFLRNIQSSGVTHWVDSPNSAFVEGVHLKRVLQELLRRHPQVLDRQAGGESHGLYRLRRDGLELVENRPSRPYTLVRAK